MTERRGREKREKTTGPFSPPLPKTAEDTEHEPMAVANDKQQTHGESFVATSAPLDAYDADVARRYHQAPPREMMPEKSDETREAQHPPGYTEPDEHGWAKPVAGEEEGEREEEGEG